MYRDDRFVNDRCKETRFTEMVDLEMIDVKK